MTWPHRILWFVALTVATSCSSGDDAAPESVPQAAFRPAVGSVTSENMNALVEGGPKRYMTVGRSKGDDASLLEALAAASVAQGWKKVRCVTRLERCFERGDWFVAAVARNDVERHGGIVGGYEKKRRQHVAEVLAVVQARSRN